MKMENAENTMPFICSPILTHTPAQYVLSLTTWIFVLFTCVISLVWPCICINPANVTTVLLLYFALRVMHSFSRAQIHPYTRTRTQTSRKRIERQNSIPFHIRCRALARSPNFLRVSHLSSYTYLRQSVHTYISACVYAEYKIPFFSHFDFLLRFCTQYYLHTSEKFLIIKLQSL